MDLSKWYTAAQKCGIIYYMNNPSKANLSAHLNLYTIVSHTWGTRLARAFPQVDGQYNETLAKKLGFKLDKQAFKVMGVGTSRSEQLIDLIHSACEPEVKRHFIYTELLSFDK